MKRLVLMLLIVLTANAASCDDKADDEVATPSATDPPETSAVATPSATDPPETSAVATPTATDPPETSAVVNTQTAQLGSLSGDVGCTRHKVFAGPSTTLSRVSPCSSSGRRHLDPGSRISVDSAGEAYLNLTNDTGNRTIWIFHSGSLTLSTCGEAASTQGNCVTGFTTWSEDNPGAIVITPTARITLVGTYVLVGYVESSSVTIVVPFEGEISAQSTLDGGADAQNFEVGSFWTNSDLDPVGTVQPTDQLPEIAATLGIESWLLAARQRAALDGVEVPAGVSRIRSVNLIGSGALAEPAVADLLLAVIDWAAVAGTPTVTALLGSAAPIDVLALDGVDQEAVPELATAVPAVDVYFDLVDGAEASESNRIAELIVRQLGQFGIKATSQPVTPERRDELMTAFEEDAVPALFVTGD